MVAILDMKPQKVLIGYGNIEWLTLKRLEYEF